MTIPKIKVCPSCGEEYDPDDGECPFCIFEDDWDMGYDYVGAHDYRTCDCEDYPCCGH